MSLVPAAAMPTAKAAGVPAALGRPASSSSPKVPAVPVAIGIVVVGMRIIGIRIVIVGVAIAVGTIVPIVAIVTIAPIVARIISLIRRTGGQDDHETQEKPKAAAHYLHLRL